VDGALYQLDDAQEAVVRMRYIFGYSHQEIAGALNISTEQSQTLAYSGLRNLKELVFNR